MVNKRKSIEMKCVTKKEKGRSGYRVYRTELRNKGRERQQEEVNEHSKSSKIKIVSTRCILSSATRMRSHKL